MGCVAMYLDELVCLSEPKRVIMQVISDNGRFDICESERRSNLTVYNKVFNA